MSIEAIAAYIRQLNQTYEQLSYPNNCRGSSAAIAAAVTAQFGQARVGFLAYPEAGPGANVHYSVLIREGRDQLLVNLVAAPGLPEYIGDPDDAVPTFRAMKPSKRVV